MRLTVSHASLVIRWLLVVLNVCNARQPILGAFYALMGSVQGVIPVLAISWPIASAFASLAIIRKVLSVLHMQWAARYRERFKDMQLIAKIWIQV